MVYLEKTTGIQDVYIPRQHSINVKQTGIDLSQYLTSGETIELIDEKVEESMSGYATEQYVDDSLTAYTTTEEVQDIVNQAISGIDLDDYYTSAQTETAIANAISGIPTEFKTINGSGITGTGNLEIDGASYTAGDNINISEENVISVTGLSDYVTSAEVKTQVEEYGYITGYTETDPVFTASPAHSITTTDIDNWNSKPSSGDVANAIESATSGYVSSGEVAAQIESYEYITSAAIPTSNTAFTNDAGYLTEHQSLSAYSTTDEVEGMISESEYGLTAEIERQGLVISEALNDLDDRKADRTEIPTVPTSNTAFTNDAGYLTEHQSLSAYSTTDEVEGMITAATATKQDTLESGVNIKTINNESILGSGNITIQGGGGGETVVELTKAQYEALTGYAEDTTYVITDADTIDINDFAMASAVTELATEMETKANKATVTANTGRLFPRWNAEGIVTGTTGNTVFERNMTINGSNNTILRPTNSDFGGIFAPTTTGTKNQVLLSNGSGAPGWSTVTMQFISQSEYDAIVTKDANCIYFIISE